MAEPYKITNDVAAQLIKPRILQRSICGAYSQLVNDLLNTNEALFRKLLYCHDQK